MLQSLHVHNFALIEDAAVEFTGGFNIFTGETGAGKSILIDAFGMVLGGRASAAFVRSGTDAFWVQAVFNVSDDKVKALLSENLRLYLSGNYIVSNIIMPVNPFSSFYI